MKILEIIWLKILILILRHTLQVNVLALKIRLQLVIFSICGGVCGRGQILIQALLACSKLTY